MNQFKHKPTDHTVAPLSLHQIKSVSKKKKDVDEKPYEYWLKKNWYYHKLIINFYRFVIPEGSSVLQINCKNGYLLDAVKPLFGVGIESDETIIASTRHQYPLYQFYTGLEKVPARCTFDYIMLSLVTMEIEDIQGLFQQLQAYCHPGTRIIIDTYSYLWEPILWITQKLGL